MSFIYRNTILLVLFLSVTACGGGSSGVAQAPTIQYAKTVSVADGTLADYMNADWLYQNYLGEYGLPAEVKPLFIPELQMLANGFALQFKRGEDVQLSIKQFHQGVMMLNASGQMAQFFAQIKQDPATFVNAATTQGGAQQTPLTNAPSQGHVISAEEQAMIDKGKLHNAQDDSEWERVRKAYDLPYEILGRVEKWAIYSHAMKPGKSGGRPPNSPPTPAPSPTYDHSIKGWWWANGEIIWLGGNWNNPYGHMGMIDTTTYPNDLSAIEANTYAGVERRIPRDMNLWANAYPIAEGYGLNLWWYEDVLIRNKAVAYTASKIGQKYNWLFWNKQGSNSSYCSQLIWQAYYNQGFDLDSDGGLVVFPRDITRSQWVSMFHYSSPVMVMK